MASVKIQNRKVGLAQPPRQLDHSHRCQNLWRLNPWRHRCDGLGVHLRSVRQDGAINGEKFPIVGCLARQQNLAIARSGVHLDQDFWQLNVPDRPEDRVTSPYRLLVDNLPESDLGQAQLIAAMQHF